MKKISIIIATIFLIVAVFSPMGLAQAPKGKKGPGGKKGKSKGPVKNDPQYKDFVKMYDKDGDGEVSIKEYFGE